MIQKTDARLGLRVSKDELKAYKKAARANDRSVNSWVRVTLYSKLKEVKNGSN